MTAILWKDNQLIVDSLIQNNIEWFQDAEKVMIVRKELFWQNSLDEVGDPILGMTYTGARKPAMALCERIRVTSELVMVDAIEKGELTLWTGEMVTAPYEQAADLKLFNEENMFTALLIGVSFNYLIHADPSGFRVERKKKDETIMLGSGASYMAALDRRCQGEANAIRMMHYAELMDGQCGGRLYLYEVEPDRHSHIGYQLALHALYETADHFQLGASNIIPHQPVAPDLILNEKAERRTRAAKAQVAMLWKDYNDARKRILQKQRKTKQAARAAEKAVKATPTKKTRTRKT